MYGNPILIVIAVLILFVVALVVAPAGAFFRVREDEDTKSGKNASKHAGENAPSGAQGSIDPQLIKALSKTALIHFDINLTHDRILGGVIQEYADGSSIDVLESIGLHANCRLSEFVSAWRDFVEPGSLDAYDEFLDCEKLIRAFRNGNEEVSLTYATVNARREETWAKQTMMMYEDAESGDIIAFCYANDVTRQMLHDGLHEAVREEHHALQTGEGIDPVFLNIIHALSDTALAFFHINITRNAIVGGISQDYSDGQHVDILAQLGLSDNCAFTDFVAAWRGFVEESFLPAYDDFFNIKNLTDSFESGISEVTLTYKTPDARGDDMWAKQSIMMTRDAVTGDIMGFSYAHDVTRDLAHEAGKEAAS